MRLSRFLVPVALLAITFLALPTEKAHACSCMLADPESAFAEGNMVFHGKVLGIASSTENGQNTVAFSVDTVWAGPNVNGIVLNTADNSAACGVEFEIGQEYTVVANRTEGNLQVFSCGQYYKNPETQEGMSPEELVKDREPLVMNNDVNCTPYVCKNGDVFPSCTDDGHSINYFAAACHMSGGDADVEEGEDETIPGAMGGEFSDVPEGNANFEAVEWARQNGIVQGYADGSFKPNAYVNRAEFLKILLEAYDLDTGKMCKLAPFPDVSSLEWYGPYVYSALCNNIISGYPDHTFRPAENINFAEAAKIIVNLDANGAVTADAGRLWYQPYINYLKVHGVTASLVPGLNVTRGDMVKMMYQVVGAPLPEKGTVSGNLQATPSEWADMTGLDYMLLLDKPMRDPKSAAGTWMMTAKLMLQTTDAVSNDTLHEYFGQHVTLSGHMANGAAETRVFVVEAIAVE